MQDEIYLKSWFIPFENIEDYQAQYFLTHHVVYSQQGNWGVFVNCDDFLMLGWYFRIHNPNHSNAS